MNFKQAIISGFQNYATFFGRASRSEYWYWVLFTFLCNVVLGFMDAAMFGTSLQSASPLSGLFSLATLIPSCSVAARRLHDINRSGWWQLICFTIIGIPVLIYWECKKGNTGDNRFGTDPLKAKPVLPITPSQSSQL